MSDHAFSPGSTINQGEKPSASELITLLDPVKEDRSLSYPEICERYQARCEILNTYFASAVSQARNMEQGEISALADVFADIGDYRADHLRIYVQTPEQVKIREDFVEKFVEGNSRLSPEAKAFLTIAAMNTVGHVFSRYPWCYTKSVNEVYEENPGKICVEFTGANIYIHFDAIAHSLQPYSPMSSPESGGSLTNLRSKYNPDSKLSQEQ